MEIPQRHLLLVAAFIWAFAGIILGIRGGVFIIHYSRHQLVDFLFAIVAGTIFFEVVFAKISQKYIKRIKSLPLVSHCFFTFFSIKSYFMMALMIGMGVTIRKLNIIEKEYLYTFFICMSIPLMISAVRFFYAWVNYNRE